MLGRDLTEEERAALRASIAAASPQRTQQQVGIHIQADLLANYRSTTHTLIKCLGMLRQSSLELFEKGRGNQEPKVRGTLWAAYNGVTELVDHHMNYRNRWQRLDSLWFGEGERTKHRAFDQANIIVTTA
jgi:hypothetical protein